MAARVPVEIDRKRIEELTSREAVSLDARTQGSKAFYERARASLVGGVASSYQSRVPWPLYLSHGKGPKAWGTWTDNEWLDFHNGFGSMVQGHAHLVITRAVMHGSSRYRLRRLRRRTRSSSARSSRGGGGCRMALRQSGSEATMDVIRIAGAATGRDTIVKIFGAWTSAASTTTRWSRSGSSTTGSATASTCHSPPTAGHSAGGGGD